MQVEKLLEKYKQLKSKNVKVASRDGKTIKNVKFESLTSYKQYSYKAKFSSKATGEFFLSDCNIKGINER